jgi:hypothetical protein
MSYSGDLFEPGAARAVALASPLENLGVRGASSGQPLSNLLVSRPPTLNEK